MASALTLLRGNVVDATISRAPLRCIKRGVGVIRAKPPQAQALTREKAGPIVRTNGKRPIVGIESMVVFMRAHCLGFTKNVNRLFAACAPADLVLVSR